MLTFIKQLLAPPVFPNDESRTQQAYLLNIILWGLTVVAVASFPLSPRSALVGLTANIILLVILKLRYVQAAAVLQLLLFWITFTYMAYTGSGTTDPAYLLGFSLVIVIAGIVIGSWGAAAITGLVLLTGAYFVYAASTGLKAFTNFENSALAYPYSIIMFLMGALLQYLAASTTQRAMQRARISEAELKNTNETLKAFSADLEKRVEMRTSDLALLNRQMTRRAAQLQAVSDVIRAIASIQNMELFLPEIARAISRSFNVYHVGIFLIDENRQFAELRASNRGDDHHLSNRSYRLSVGRVGLVGNVAATGQPRVSLNTSEDNTYISDPDLPDTRCEMAVPLKIGPETVGVLDIHSTEADAFSPEDVDVMNTLAFQIANAIQNARLFSQTRAALSEAEAAFQKYVSENWQDFQQSLNMTGLTLKDRHVSVLENELSPSANNQAISTGTIAIEAGTQPVLAVPIKVRGTTIGVLNVRAASATRSWSNDELITAQTIADRVAIALENARLVEETRERAARERAISEMTNRIGASIDMDNILATAVRELGRLVPDSNVIIQLGRTSKE